MRIKNTTDYPTTFIRAMLRWAIREAEVPKNERNGQYLRLARFTRSSYKHYKGWALAPNITVRIGAPTLTWPVNVAWRAAYRGVNMEQFLLDRTATLVHITAHELAHIRLSRKGYKNNERNADSLARFVTMRFLKDRAALMARWGLPEAAPADLATATVAEQVADNRAGVTLLSA